MEVAEPMGVWQGRARVMGGFENLLHRSSRVRTRSVCVAIVVWMVSGVVPAADDVPRARIDLTNGQSIEGEWDSSQSAGRFTVRVNGQSRIVPFDQVVVARFGRQGELAGDAPVDVPPPSALVLLTDRSRWAGRIVSADVDTLRLRCIGLQPSAQRASVPEIEIPLSVTAAVLVQAPRGREEQVRLANWLERASSSLDGLRTTEGDDIAGEFEAVDEQQIRLQGPGGLVAVPRWRTQAIRFRSDLLESSNRPAFWGVVELNEGTLLVASEFRAAAQTLDAVTSAGSVSIPVERIRSVRMVSSRIVPVWDVPPQLPIDRLMQALHGDRPAPAARPRPQPGAILQAASWRFVDPWAWTVEGDAATWQVDVAGFDRFEAEWRAPRITDGATGRGRTTAEIRVDGTSLWKWTAGLNGGASIEPVRIDVRGATRLELTTIDAGDVGTLRWRFPRLVRGP